MAFLRQAFLLLLISWSLILPARMAGEDGDAVAASSASQPSMEWGSYDTKKACEQDRTKYLSDQADYSLDARYTSL